MPLPANLHDIRPHLLYTPLTDIERRTIGAVFLSGGLWTARGVTFGSQADVDKYILHVTGRKPKLQTFHIVRPKALPG